MQKKNKLIRNEEVESRIQSVECRGWSVECGMVAGQGLAVDGKLWRFIPFCP